MNKESDGWVRVFEVKEPQRHRKGFTVYKVVSRVFHKNSIDGITEIVIFKRFSEFKKLHKSLSQLHSSLHLKGVFPSFPDSKLFGRFEAEVVESRRQSALELLDFAGKYPPLFTSAVFVKFFENSVTNFTTVSRHHVIDRDNDQEDNHLPQPLEPNPNLNLSDDWSQISGDNGSDGTNSTPIYSTPSSPYDQKTPPKAIDKTDLRQFDPLNKGDDNSVDKLRDNGIDWLIPSVPSSDRSKDISQTSDKMSAVDDILQIIPEPFATSAVKDAELKVSVELDSKDKSFINQFSIRCDIDDNGNAFVEEVPNDSQNSDQIQSPNTSQTTDTNDTYLLDAAIILRQAQQYEENEEWEPSFESYKCAVGILLQGVVNETDSEKKASIRRKTFQYLTRAEHIFDTYLSKENSFQPSRRWAPDSPFKSMNASLLQSWFGSCKELAKFKVIGLSDNVQIVTDLTTHNTFAIKVIYKSNPNNSSKHLLTDALTTSHSIFPNDIPYMAQIYRIFKTEYALFLLLEYAKGGKLWDKLTSSNRNSLSPCPDCMFNFDDDDYAELIADHPYSGRRISRTQSECGPNPFGENHMNSIYETVSEQQMLRKCESIESCSPTESLASIESIDFDVPSKSYSNLCANYAFVQQKCSNNSVLANCRFDSIDSIDSITECESTSRTNIPSLSADKPKAQPKLTHRQSTESLGITGLLAKARGILKNVDNTLNLTKYVTKNSFGIKNNELRSSKSEMTLTDKSQVTTQCKPISEICHQMDGQWSCSSARPPVGEDDARKWLSQVVLCLQHLHKLGLIYCDLKPDNLLLTEDHNLCISYKCFWNESPVDAIDQTAKDRLYVAPEIFSSHKISHLCDWWSLGVLAFEILTGRSLVSYYPNGITSHTSLYFPVFIPLEAKDFINKLLEPNPSERLGRHGSEEITTHPFFEGINWTNDL